MRVAGWRLEDIDDNLAADFDGSLSGLGVDLSVASYNMRCALATPLFSFSLVAIKETVLLLDFSLTFSLFYRVEENQFLFHFIEFFSSCTGVVLGSIRFLEFFLSKDFIEPLLVVPYRFLLGFIEILPSFTRFCYWVLLLLEFYIVGMGFYKSLLFFY